MKTEMLLVFMASIVLSLFLIVIEIAALRKRASKIRTRLIFLYQSGRILMLIVDVSLISLFFLIQPLIVAYIVTHALNKINPDFSRIIMLQLWEVFLK